jgi:glycosyltransferase involved in cell wall biosynthesis
MKYSIVIPVFNSARSLPDLHGRLVDTCEKCIKESFEVIYVDDASQDGSWPVLNEMRLKDKRVTIIQLMKNSGQHAALMTGLSYASGEYVITMDDDLQQPPEEIPKLIRKINERPGSDAVMAVPAARKHSLFRNIGSYCANYLLLMMLNKPSRLRFSSYFIMTRRIKDALLSFSGRNTTIPALIFLISDRVANVEVLHTERKYGRSNYTLRKLIDMTMTFVFNFNTLPLKLMILIGFVSSIFAFIMMVTTALNRIFGVITSPGFATTTILITLFSGIILFSIGIIGEYLLNVIKYINLPKGAIIRQVIRKEGPVTGSNENWNNTI